MRRKLKTFFIGLACLLILSSITSGQSGRRAKKTPPQPPVQGVNQPDARVQPEPEAEVEKPEDKGPRRTIMILTSMPDISIPLYYADIARRGCLSEIRAASKTIDVREDSNQNRSDAIKIAKDDENTYVVLIDLELDRFGTSRTGVDMRYTLFEPKTGKVIGTGTGYPVQPSGGIPVPPIGASYDQVYVDWMGRDVGRQVLRRIGIIP